jgi:hypothetical protein
MQTKIPQKVMAIVADLRRRGFLDKEIRTMAFYALGANDYARRMVEMVWSPAIRESKQMGH